MQPHKNGNGDQQQSSKTPAPVSPSQAANANTADQAEEQFPPYSDSEVIPQQEPTPGPTQAPTPASRPSPGLDKEEEIRLIAAVACHDSLLGYVPSGPISNSRARLAEGARRQESPNGSDTDRKSGFFHSLQNAFGLGGDHECEAGVENQTELGGFPPYSDDPQSPAENGHSDNKSNRNGNGGGIVESPIAPKAGSGSNSPRSNTSPQAAAAHGIEAVESDQSQSEAQSGPSTGIPQGFSGSAVPLEPIALQQRYTVVEQSNQPGNKSNAEIAEEAAEEQRLAKQQQRVDERLQEEEEEEEEAQQATRSQVQRERRCKYCRSLCSLILC